MTKKPVADEIQRHLRDSEWAPGENTALADGSPLELRQEDPVRAFAHFGRESTFEDVFADPDYSRAEKDHFEIYASRELADYCARRPTLRRATDQALRQLHSYLEQSRGDTRPHPTLTAVLWSDPESHWNECLIQVVVNRTQRDRWYSDLPKLFEIATAGTRTPLTGPSIKVGISARE